MSLVSSRKFKLENARKKGVRGADSALELSENPTKFLSTVQIGITIIGILLGMYSGNQITSDVENFLSQFVFLQAYAKNLAVGIVVVSVAYVSIVLGELLPKRIGLAFPEPISMVLAKPMKILSTITSPFVWLLTSTNDIILRILGIKNNLDSKVSEEEIKSLIKESADGGEIQDIEQNIVERVFELGDRKVNSLMTHRSDLVYFDSTENYEAISKKINEEKHSAYPVVTNDDIDEIVGIVLLKDLFNSIYEEDFNINDYIKKPIFINDSALAYKLLENFKSNKMHYAIVVDEFGSTQGMVTMDDLLDALVGDVTEYNQSEYELVQRNENSWLVDGQYPIIEFVKQFNIEIDEDQEDYFVTVAGMIIHKCSAIPNVGDIIKVGDINLEVIDKDGQRIDKILVTKT
jgi:putative hemolysin